MLITNYKINEHIMELMSITDWKTNRLRPVENEDLFNHLFLDNRDKKLITCPGSREAGRKITRTIFKPKTLAIQK